MKKLSIIFLGLLISLSAVLADDSSLTNGLIDYWTMDEPEGVLKGANGNNMERYGDPFYQQVDCKRGGCYEVQGSGNAIPEAQTFSTTNDLRGIDGNDDICVAFWGVLKSDKEDALILFSMQDPQTILSLGLSVKLSSGGVASWDRSTVDPEVRQVPANKDYTTSEVPTLDVLSHYIFCNSPKEGRFFTYINGEKVLDESSGIDLSSEGTPATLTLVGNQPSTGINFGVGQSQIIDEIGVWNRLLTQEEITTLQTKDPFGKRYVRAAVPDFILLILTIAIIVVGLGVVILRKRF